MNAIVSDIIHVYLHVSVDTMQRVNKMRAPVRQKYAQDTQQLSVLTHMVFSGSSANVFAANTHLYGLAICPSSSLCTVLGSDW